MSKETRIKEIDKQIAELQAEKKRLSRITDDEKTNEKVKQYLGRNSGQELLKKHSLDEEGTWEVRGEDPNCDFGGYHHMPSLGFYKGKLEDVIKVAVNLPRFWQWGAGGDIKKKEDDMIVDLTK